MTDNASLIAAAMAAMETLTQKPARDLQPGDVVYGVGCPRTTLTEVTLTKRGLVRTVDSNWGVRHHNAFDVVTVAVFS